MANLTYDRMGQSSLLKRAQRRLLRPAVLRAEVDVSRQLSAFGNIVICNGMPRSASTWSFNVVMELLRETVGGPIVHGYNEDVERFVSQAQPSRGYIVVKCHSLQPLGRTLARNGKAKVIYTRRAVADAVASSMRMWGHDFDRALRAIDASLELYAFHRDHGNALVLGYETIVRSPVRSVEEVAAYLGLELPPRTAERVADATSVERMRETADQLTAPECRDRLVKVDAVRYDPVTLLHPSHIQDGGSGYGRQLISARNLAKIDTVLARHGLEE